ncbi:MAG: hypothetical protein DSY90_12445 [Deltaproteobacteria bacterium]|nr:MAG: hypothetical protein DSY90_12445 [Deltaproteobacteria bacterium]
MAQEIKIPKLGLTMTDAILASWLVPAGAQVTEDQIICAIETDKVSFEVPAPCEGLLHPVVEAGRRVEVGERVGYIAVDEAELSTLQEAVPVAGTGPAEGKSDDFCQPREKGEAGEPPVSAASAPRVEKRGGDRIVASPAARKLSQATGVELCDIEGTGPGGRIILADVEAFTEAARAERDATRYNFGSAVPETDLLTAAETVPIRGIRKIISKNMKLSLSSQAQLTLHTEASAADLKALRTVFNARLEDDHPRVSYNTIIVKATAVALRLYPMLNASVDGHQIKVWDQIHIGVAMDFGQGLVVPKIRNTDTKSILDIAGELSDLARRAEKKRLFPDELSGGTFTITNLGGWDIDHFSPIVNFPESAILGVGRIMEKPWVQEGRVIADLRIPLSLTFDHRIIDGALAAQFLKALKDRLEDTRLML